jgi:signal transduction histidine kinase
MTMPPVTDAIPPRRTPTDIRDLLRWSLEALRGQAETFDIGLRIRVDDNVPAAVLLDRSKIAWAITALVGNALRYVRHGTQTMPGGSITVHVALDSAARQLVIDVQDDGPGIAADRLRALLNDRTGAPATALGLLMVREVAVAHGGTFNIDSETNGFTHGTTVRVTLPVAG